jgi:membrane protein
LNFSRTISSAACSEPTVATYSTTDAGDRTIPDTTNRRTRRRGKSQERYLGDKTRDDSNTREESPSEDWHTSAQHTVPEGPEVAIARAAERGRGREARYPDEIPFLGWRDILWRVVKSIPTDRVLATSGSVAFFALLAVFPAVATMVSLYGLFADTHTISRHLVLLSGVLPVSGIDLLGEQMTYIAGQSVHTLGLAFVVGLAVAFWSANSGVVSLFDALNVVYREREKRSLLRLYSLSFLFTLGAIAITVAGVGGVVVLPIVLNLFGLGTWSERLIAIGRWPFLLVIAITALSLLYRYGPSRRVAKWRWVSWGSVAAAISWIGMSMIFSWYVTHFNSFNRVYGALGAVMGYMTWIWFSIVVVLVGAELNAEMELQTAVDSTEGRPRRLGLRGAIVADSIGESQV